MYLAKDLVNELRSAIADLPHTYYVYKAVTDVIAKLESDNAEQPEPKQPLFYKVYYPQDIKLGSALSYQTPNLAKDCVEKAVNSDRFYEVTHGYVMVPILHYTKPEIKHAWEEV